MVNVCVCAYACTVKLRLMLPVDGTAVVFVYCLAVCGLAANRFHVSGPAAAL